MPHLLVNLASEYSYIRNTFDPRWKSTHPSALSNLALARTCLSYMPSSSSAVMVSHRSPSSLIANLITNKPAVSSSLPHALLQGNRKIDSHTPTILRRGLDVRVIRSASEIDRVKMKALLDLVHPSVLFYLVIGLARPSRACHAGKVQMTIIGDQ